MFINYLHIVAWDWPSYTAWQCWQHSLKVIDVSEIGSDGPSSFGLPPVIIDNNFREMLMDPPYGVGVAAFTHQVKAL